MNEMKPHNGEATDRKWYTVDAVRRVYVEATSELEAEVLANKRFFDQEPDGEYYNQVTRVGVWHLFEVGDETDALCVWNPYKKEGVES